MMRGEVPDDEKQLVFALTFLNKENSRGITEEIICPAGMSKPRDLARFLADEAGRRVKKLVTPNNVELLLMK